jgi:hypothetical protein
MNKMDNKNIYKLIVLFFIVGFVVIFLVDRGDNIIASNNIGNQAAQVRTGDYVALEPLPGLTDNATAQNDIGNYLQVIFNWGIALAVVLSTLMIIVGGVQYMTIDSVAGKSDGIEKIKGAVAGLILALSAWLILNQINPQLLNRSLSIIDVTKDEVSV